METKKETDKEIFLKLLNLSDLSEKQKKSVQELFKLCKEKDQCRGICFLEKELNEIPDFPCFFLLYDKDILIGFLSVFVASMEECEIYLQISPEYRDSSGFACLFDAVKARLSEYKIKNAFVVLEPGYSQYEQWLRWSGAEYSHSEYLLAYHGTHLLEVQEELEYEIFETDEGIVLELYQGEKVLGTISADLCGKTACIHQVEVMEAYRGQGFGKQLLALCVNELMEMDYQKIILQVSGKNKIACQLYLRHGFEVEQQMDYWVLTY